MESDHAPGGSTVNAALEQVRARIADACRRAGRSVGEVVLVAVSKKQPLERVREAHALGQRVFGENYVQELETRMRDLPDAEWHMIGHVQTNKAKKAIAAHTVHSVDSDRLARALSKAAAEAGKNVRVLIEVNVADEATKSGVGSQETETLIGELRTLPALQLAGLMCIPPPGETRRYFATLRTLRDHLSNRTGVALPELSMGMSHDFEEAILEGATIVRVGTAIFGERS